MQKYEELIMEIITFENEDIITNSDIETPEEEY